ncbi:MAG: serine hydrolase domain-containing protein [Ruegeria sp.]
MNFDPNRMNRISDWMSGYVENRKYAGCSFLLVQSDNEVFFHATGQRSVENNLPFLRDTLTRIYSMTKPVTTVALMMLAEQGHFHLEAPVADFIPEFQNPFALVPGATRIDQVEEASPPTIHQLLTHTSGLSYPFNPGVLSKKMDERDLMFKSDHGPLAGKVSELAQLPLAFQPGSRWEYSVGIDVIGRVIEVISGQSLDRFMQQEIFDPLGMTETSFSLPNGCQDRFASLYTPLSGDAMALNAAKSGGDTLRLVEEAGNSPFENATMFSGGGGLVSTIDDYSRFAAMLRNGGRGHDKQLLGPATLDFMMRNHLPGDIASMGPQSFAEQPMDGMGFGLGGAVVLDPARARTPGSVGDFSWGGMASTFFWIDRQHDFHAIFFTQLSPSSSYPSRSELKSLVQAALI